MSKQTDGGPAFPVADQGVHGTFGMSLRDWFAGQALAGLLASDVEDSRAIEGCARLAYELADAMLADRDR